MIVCRMKFVSIFRIWPSGSRSKTPKALFNFEGETCAGKSVAEIKVDVLQAWHTEGECDMFHRAVCMKLCCCERGLTEG